MFCSVLFSTSPCWLKDTERMLSFVVMWSGATVLPQPQRTQRSTAGILGLVLDKQSHVRRHSSWSVVGNQFVHTWDQLFSNILKTPGFSSVNERHIYATWSGMPVDMPYPSPCVLSCGARGHWKTRQLMFATVLLQSRNCSDRISGGWVSPFCLSSTFTQHLCVPDVNYLDKSPGLFNKACCFKNECHLHKCIRVNVDSNSNATTLKFELFCKLN